MEMKEYMTPEMEVMEMKYSQALLDGSISGSTDENPGSGGEYTGGPIDD